MREEPHRVLGAESRKSCPTHPKWGHVHHVSPTKYGDFMGKYGDYDIFNLQNMVISWEKMFYNA